MVLQLEISNDVELKLKLTANFLGQVLQKLTESLMNQEVDVSSTANLRIIGDYIQGVQQRDLDCIANIIDDSFCLTSETLPLYGFSNTNTDREGYLQLWQKLWNVFPDTQYRPEKKPFAIGNLVVYFWKGSGIQNGTWAEVEATNRPMEINGCSIFQFEQEKIVAEYDFFDTGNLLDVLESAQNYSEDLLDSAIFSTSISSTD